MTEASEAADAIRRWRDEADRMAASSPSEIGEAYFNGKATAYDAVLSLLANRGEGWWP